MTARVPDINGWFEVRDNPLSKVGVFDYLGKSIDSTGAMGLDPDKIYPVYRPESELSSPETINSFKLLPWIDEHTMLGKSDNGLTPAEKKGIEGVIGEDVYFKSPKLYGNIKLFSEDLAEQVNAGKKELSCGYRCKYKLERGIFGDQEYQVIQHTIRGNHLASVPEGRMGPDVAVLDSKDVFKFTIDSAELKAMAQEDEKLTGDAAIAALTKSVGDLTTMVGDVSEKVKDMEEKSKTAEDEEAEAVAKKKAEDEEAEKKEKAKTGEDGDEEKEAMDARIKGLEDTVTTATDALETYKKDGMKSLMGEIGKRDALAAKVSEHTGTFDHSDMTVEEVAVYAVDKLELGEVTKGHEVTAVNAFLTNRPKNAGFIANTGQDAVAVANGVKAVDNHFSQKAS